MKDEGRGMKSSSTEVKNRILTTHDSRLTTRAPSFILHPSVGRPPIPHEHGAWVILYAPLVIAFAAARPFALGPALLLVLAVTGLYLARNAAGLLFRWRGKEGTAFWLAVYLLLAAAGALPLLLAYGRTDLLLLGLIAAGLFGVHSALLVLPAKKRLDRSQWGEILAVGALALTAPAAWAVSTGRLDGRAWLLWAACALYFSSGIFFVKMLLGAVKVRGDFTTRDRRRVGRDNLLYHALLTVLVLSGAAALGGVGGGFGVLAFLPALLRAFAGAARLTNALPPLKQVGLLETAYSLWFMGFLLAALLAG
jgi:hypothetical protein